MKYVIYALLFATGMAQGQNTFTKAAAETTKDPTELNINSNVKGTLLIPENVTKVPLVILFTGSGPNDRNGNSPMTRNDSHKQLAKALLENGIATYRYDKRTFTQMKTNKIDPNPTFDQFVQDAQEVIFYFERDPRFTHIILAGHSQGSLVAMLASNKDVDGFISLAGPSETIDRAIVRQIGMQAPGLDKEAQVIFDKMKSQDAIVKEVPSYLMSVLNPEIQPFMKSWMAYNPSEIINTLKMPILIINGTKDRQVDVTDANALHAAAPASQLLIVDNMGHLFKKVGDNDMENAKSYTDPSFPLHPDLVKAVSDFVKTVSGT